MKKTFSISSSWIISKLKLCHILFTFSICLFIVATSFSQEVTVINHKGTKKTVLNNVVTISNTAPTNPVIADVWLDDSDTSNIITKVYDGSNWHTISSGGSSTGDNLGNHTATSNLKLSNNWLSNDGDSEGIYIDANGKVGLGTSSPSEELDVDGTIDAKAYKATVYTSERTSSYTTTSNNS